MSSPVKSEAIPDQSLAVQGSRQPPHQEFWSRDPGNSCSLAWHRAIKFLAGLKSSHQLAFGGTADPGLPMDYSWAQGNHEDLSKLERKAKQGTRWMVAMKKTITAAGCGWTRRATKDVNGPWKERPGDKSAPPASKRDPALLICDFSLTRPNLDFRPPDLKDNVCVLC